MTKYNWNLRATGTLSALLLTIAFGDARAQALPAKPLVEAPFSISGQVVDALDGYYVLRTEGMRANIKFSDWPAEYRGRVVLGLGDAVTATGWLDATSLTVGGALDVVAVYVEDKNTYFTLNQTVDSVYQKLAPRLPPSGDAEHSVSLTGVISEIGNDNLTLSVGKMMILVDMSSLSRNPFDDIGSQKLEIGTAVMIDGVVERNTSGAVDLLAHRVTSIIVVDPKR